VCGGGVRSILVFLMECEARPVTEEQVEVYRTVVVISAGRAPV